MRRHDREITQKEELIWILAHSEVCRLAMNTGGAPYIVPLNFGYEWTDRLRLYFHCAREGRKLDLFRIDPRAGFEADARHELVTRKVACDWGMKFSSVIGTGILKEITDTAGKRHALNMLMEHYGFSGEPEYAAAMLDVVIILCLEVSEISGKANRPIPDRDMLPE
jgi:hypothetical protein